ncbi:MAG: MmcQ/YjbR family DNA-binding protein [Ginsengibacter sp.]
MNVEDIREYALSLNDVAESMPFGPDNIVFKIGGKMFLLLALDADPVQFNVKCDPEKAIQLREEFKSVLPGYHMNKEHWNTILVNGELSQEFLESCIATSYQLVKKKPVKGRK